MRINTNLVAVFEILSTFGSNLDAFLEERGAELAEAHADIEEMGMARIHTIMASDGEGLDLWGTTYVKTLEEALRLMILDFTPPAAREDWDEDYAA